MRYGAMWIPNRDLKLHLRCRLTLGRSVRTGYVISSPAYKTLHSTIKFEKVWLPFYFSLTFPFYSSLSKFNLIYYLIDFKK